MSVREEVFVGERERSKYDIGEICPIQVSHFCFACSKFSELSFGYQTLRNIILSVWWAQFRSSGQSIGHTILVARMVVDLVIVMHEHLEPVHLALIENTRSHEVFEVLVVSEDLDR
jgi:hypothetical protein